MIRLVINADDLGLHGRIDEGIFRAHREGVLTSASVLATGPAAPDAIRRAGAQGLPIGVHLCLTTGLPPAAPPDQVRSLAPGGTFRAKWPQLLQAYLQGRIRVAEVEREFRAQLQRVRELGGVPDHLDGHQHLQVLPGIARVAQRVAAEAALPIRWPMDRLSRAWLGRPVPALKTLLIGGTARLTGRGPARRIRGVGTFEAGSLDERRLLSLIDGLPEGDHEIGCHPGLAPEGGVPQEPGWHYGWETELAALTSPRVRARIAARGIRLTSFGELAS